MAYTVLTQDDLSKWWITGTGTSINRLSECMDDAPDGPAIYHLDADNAWTAGAGSEWYVATATKPDDVEDNLSGWSKLTDAGDDQMGSLNADEWTYDTGNNRVYVRLSDSSDPNATDMRCDYNWDGSGAGPAIMTEHIEDRMYQIHLRLDIGDGTTSTTLKLFQEQVYFDDGLIFYIQAQATFDIDESSIFIDVDAETACSASANNTLIVNRSHWFNRGEGYPKFYCNTVTLTDSIFGALYGTYSNSWAIYTNSANGTMTNLTFWNSKYGIALGKSPITADEITVNSDCNSGIVAWATLTITNADLSFITSDAVFAPSVGASVLSLVDLTNAVSNVTITQATSEIHEKYTVNVTVVDKDGTGIVGATVLCEGSDSGTASTEYDVEVFSADTGASGVLAEQIITARKWYGTGETLTNYNYFKFTISKPGYETLIMESVTVDAAKVWHIELQASKQPPAPWQEGMM